MKRLTEKELKEAPDYEELKWYQGVPVIVAALRRDLEAVI